MVTRLRRILEFSSTVTTIAFGVLVTFIFGYRQHGIGDPRSLKLIVSSFVTFSTFLSGLILMFLTLNLLTLNHPQTRRKQYMAVIVLTYVSSILLTLTSLSLLVLLPKNYAILAFILLPIVVIVGLLIYYHGLQLDQADSITGYEGQKAELKRSSKLSSSVTTLSFGGMVGSISGYTKNVSDLARKPHINVGFFIIFSTSLSGLFSILLALVLPSLHSPITRQRLMTFIKFFSYILLMLQAMTAIAFSHVFLEEFVLPAFFPIILGAIVWFAMEFGLEKPTDRGRCVTSLEVIELKLTSMFSTSVTSITFGGITTIFTGYIGSQADSLHLNSCVFLMLSAFISGLSLMLLTFRPLDRRSSIMAVRILTCCTIVLLALAALDVILLVV
ncbi:hypothetical protein COCNU_07G013460 [Cocos nucifera]|uniref:Uncharacterized protein n=1 Tax=Cocos nucifera TaxID=13894 RepID=A0A8K0N5Y5_COCNU|nr:hypothetical protein COCNU_07G013460 [Cocos nucifera]